jgi:uncharacterized protein YndB with AHSA1/START domain
MSADVRTEPIVHERQIGASPAPGASTIEVTLEPRDGGTWLTLVHRDLPASERANHDGGWETMLGRLASAVAQS